MLFAELWPNARMRRPFIVAIAARNCFLAVSLAWALRLVFSSNSNDFSTFMRLAVLNRVITENDAD
jgi:hypothetical protein